METIKLKVETDASNSITTLGQLEEKLGKLNTEIKSVDVNSKAFKELQKEIKATDSRVQNLSGSIKGLSTEQLTGEFGKFTGGITAAFTGIAALSGGANESMENMIKTVAKGMAIAQGFRGAAEAAQTATKLWSAAQRVLNVVMASNPIGAIIAAVAILAGGIAFLTSKIMNSSKETEINTEALKDYNDEVDKTIGKTKSESEELQKLREERSLMGDEFADVKKKEMQIQEEYTNRIKELNNQELEMKQLAQQAKDSDAISYEQMEKDKVKATNDALTARIIAEALYNEKMEALNDQRLEIEKRKNEKILQETINRLSEEYRLEQLAIENGQQLLQAVFDRADEKNRILMEKEEEFRDAWYEKFEMDDEEEIEEDPALIRALEIADFQRKNIIESQLQTQKGLKELYDDGIINYEEYINQKILLDELQSQSEMDSLATMGEIMGRSSELFGEDTIAHKFFAAAQASINTFLAASRAISEGGPILGPILAGVITMQGLAQVSKIKGTPTSYALGGVLDGPSHLNGGIQTPYGELEGGEGVINASSMSNPSLRNLASIANVGGGGRDFSSGDGSVKLSTDSISMIINGINNKKVYVSETDITEKQTKVRVTEEQSVL